MLQSNILTLTLEKNKLQQKRKGNLKLKPFVCFIDLN